MLASTRSPCRSRKGSGSSGGSGGAARRPPRRARRGPRARCRRAHPRRPRRGRAVPASVAAGPVHHHSPPAPARRVSCTARSTAPSARASPAPRVARRRGAPGCARHTSSPGPWARPRAPRRPRPRARGPPPRGPAPARSRASRRRRDPGSSRPVTRKRWVIAARLDLARGCCAPSDGAHAPDEDHRHARSHHRRAGRIDGWCAAGMDGGRINCAHDAPTAGASGRRAARGGRARRTPAGAPR